VRVDSDVAKKILECNYYGTLEATVEFLPLIRDGGRLVNVSSSSGMLIRLSPTLQERFKSAKAVSEITDLMEDYTAAVLVGNEKEQGWSDRAYATSKTGVTTMTRIFAEERKAKGSRTLINACCPGLVEVFTMFVYCVLNEF
jgi:carbonyl reductase 1